MPNWDVLLQRYSMLLGRINSLSTLLSQPFPSPQSQGAGQIPTQPIKPPSSQGQLDPSSSQPLLSHYLVHPLNPLPTSNPSTSTSVSADPSSSTPASASTPAASLNPIAPETFFQVLNTLPLPSLSESQASLLSSSDQGDDVGNTGQNGGTRTGRKEQLSSMGERELSTLLRGLEERVQRERRKAHVIFGEVERRLEEVDWALRVNQEQGEEEEEEGGDDHGEEKMGDGGEEEEKEKEESDGGLFGDDDVVMLDNPAEAQSQPLKVEVGKGGGARSSSKRATWSVGDYIKFMDTGKEPESREAPAVVS